MCDPLTIAGIVLTGGSMVANQIGASKAAKARNNVLAAERLRQQQFDREAGLLNATSQDRFTDFGGQQDDASAKLGDYFQQQRIEEGDANTQAVIDQNVAPTSSNLTMREEAKQRGQAREFTDRQGAALGELRSFGDVLGDISRSQARDAGAIGQIGGFKMGSSNVVPYELEAAANAGNGAKLIGDIMGLGGQVAMSAGLSGGAKYPKAPKAPVSLDPWNGMRVPDAAIYNLYGLKGPGLY